MIHESLLEKSFAELGVPNTGPEVLLALGYQQVGEGWRHHDGSVVFFSDLVRELKSLRAWVAKKVGPVVLAHEQVSGDLWEETAG